MEVYIIIINFLVFIMGTFFGSFYTLARHRIPRNLDIVKERSFCPVCNGKLGAKDLFPKLSYIFLGGKCRHCKEKISSKYFLTEIFTGIIFLLFFNSLNIFKIEGLLIYKVISLISFPFIFTYIYLTAKIDQDTGVIDKGLMVFGTMFAGINVFIKYVYLQNGETFSVYLSIIYLFILMILTIIQVYNVRNKNKQTIYLIDLLSTILILTIYLEPTIMAGIIGITLIIYIMYEILSILQIIDLKEKLDKKFEVDPKLKTYKKEKAKETKLKDVLLPKLTGLKYSELEQRKTMTSFVLILMYITIFIIILSNFLNI